MLLSVAIAMAFSYPTISLAESPTAGFTTYPHHVRTTAKPFEGDPKNADVEMRQIWIHGSYMQALDKGVLKSALGIQKTLVGGERPTAIFPALSEKLRSSALSWGYHSPLMYWNNSAETIDDDPDILQTINDRKTSFASLDVALRPASVFAGKRFDRSRLQAADALVITLMNKVQNGVGGRWKDKMQSLAVGTCENCTLFPHDGHVTRNYVYQFNFTPLSAQENIAFGFAYSCMALYVLLSLRRLKAFHSRFGLVVTAITQMTCSVLASLTICGILKINLSMIPQNAYPFVVLVIGLENMFRLINAILAYPATMATDQRIANALGDVGPVSVATAAQNLIILSLLASFVSPGVAAFCAFACIATLFDAFFLLTFFVAVLNVDIRRLELQDALTRSAHSGQARTRRRPSPSPHTWFDALMQGRLPFSTRMAGTAVTTTFVLSLNYHFFERHEKGSSLRHLLGLARGGPPSVADFDTFTPPPMNATLTPGEWMRMQDFDTAREVMRLAKPGADSFVIRVFAPLIIVLAGADRTGAPLGTEAWAHALRSYAVHHFYPVAVAVVFAVAFVAVLMNFLLYSEPSEADESDSERAAKPLVVQTLQLPHKLDIVKLSGTPSGHFVTIGLDKTAAVSVYDKAQHVYSVIDVPFELLSALQWPIRNIALDRDGDCLACHGADDQILVYSCAAGAVVRPSIRYPDDNPPVLFEVIRLWCDEAMKPYMLVLTSGGRMMTCDLTNSHASNRRLSDVPLLGAVMLEGDGQDDRLLVATENARIITYGWNDLTWSERASQSLSLYTQDNRMTGVVEIRTYAELGEDILVVKTRSFVVFLDAPTLSILSKVTLDIPGDLIIHSNTRCPACGSVALSRFGVAAQQDGDVCRMISMVADGEEQAPMCLRNKSSSCNSLDWARKKECTLTPAGAWQALGACGALGLRKRAVRKGGTVQKSSGSAHSRRRRHSHKSNMEVEEIRWEAYAFSFNGDLETVDAPCQSEADTEHGTELYVNTAGPAVSIGTHSVAVAFGNTVKIVRASPRGSMAQHHPNGASLQRHNSTSKKRVVSRKAQ